MRRALSSRWLTRALRTSEALPATGLPLFLCPAVGQFRIAPLRIPRHFSHKRLLHTESSIVKEEEQNLVEKKAEEQRELPFSCSGCGAFTQTSDSNQLGYFDVTAKRVRTWLSPPKIELQDKDVQENQVIDNVLKSMDSDQLTALGFDASNMVVEERVNTPPPGKWPIYDNERVQ